LQQVSMLRPLKKKKLVIVLFILQIRWGGGFIYFFYFFILKLNIQNLARMSKDRNSSNRACAISTSIITDRGAEGQSKLNFVRTRLVLLSAARGP
jgi:hypothetical protein